MSRRRQCQTAARYLAQFKRMAQLPAGPQPKPRPEAPTPAKTQLLTERELNIQVRKIGTGAEGMDNLFPGLKN